MKQCSYCGTKAADDAVQCDACGARSFSNICPNCGKVFETGSYCPVCGTKAGSKSKTCPHCGTGYFTNACPNCGYTAAQQSSYNTPGHTQTQSTSSGAHSGSYTQSAQGTQSGKKFGCGKILLWLFFWPIMLIITVWKSRMKVIWKILLTLLILGVFGIFSASTENSGTGSSDSTGLNVPVITSTAKPTATATAKPAATASPAATKAPATVAAPSIAGKATEAPIPVL